MPSGKLHIEVPKFNTNAYLVHPEHRQHFIEDTFGFWQVPAGGIDPHGYLDKFWHVEVLKGDKINPIHKEHVHVNMYPNKPGGRFEYVVVDNIRK